MSGCNYACENVELIWEEFQSCIKRIQNNTEEARSLLCQLSQYDAMKFNIGYGDHKKATQTSSLEVYDGETTISDQVTNSLKKWDNVAPGEFQVNTSVCDIPTIWQLWKLGTPSMPSIDFMNAKYGYLSFIGSSKDRIRLNSWGKVVEEISAHLEAGRDLDEVLVVASLFLERVNGNLTQLSRSIMENAEHNKSTFFELSSSSRGSMQ